MSYLFGIVEWTSWVIEYSVLIGAFLTGVAGPVILAIVRHRLSRNAVELETRKKDFVNTLETQKIVNESLNTFQNEYNLDRIWLAQFHNGGNYYPGNKCMKKMSVSFESTSPGISSDVMKMQNLPVSFFSTPLQKLSSGQESFIIDVDTESDQALRSFWENRGINTVFIFPIIDIKGVFIGILGVDFIKREGVLSEAIFNQLKREANVLSGYISLLSNEDHK